MQTGETKMGTEGGREQMRGVCGEAERGRRLWAGQGDGYFSVLYAPLALVMRDPCLTVLFELHRSPTSAFSPAAASYHAPAFTPVSTFSSAPAFSPASTPVTAFSFTRVSAFFLAPLFARSAGP